MDSLSVHHHHNDARNGSAPTSMMNERFLKLAPQLLSGCSAKEEEEYARNLIALQELAAKAAKASSAAGIRGFGKKRSSSSAIRRPARSKKSKCNSDATPAQEHASSSERSLCSWEDRMSAVRRYFDTHGDGAIPQKWTGTARGEHNLGRWVARVRYVGKKVGFSQKKISQLNACGFAWNVPGSPLVPQPPKVESAHDDSSEEDDSSYRNTARTYNVEAEEDDPPRSIAASSAFISNRKREDSNADRETSEEPSSDAPGDWSSEPLSGTHCICNSSEEDGFMIECESCKRWFHGECIGVTAAQARKLDTFECPRCLDKSSSEEITDNDDGDDDPPPSPIRPTRRRASRRTTANDDSTRVYCICRSSFDDGFMIGCDSCDEWFHGKCIGLRPSQARKLKSFVCQSCKDKARKT